MAVVAVHQHLVAVAPARPEVAGAGFPAVVAVPGYPAVVAVPDYPAVVAVPGYPAVVVAAVTGLSVTRFHHLDSGPGTVCPAVGRFVSDWGRHPFFFPLNSPAADHRSYIPFRRSRQGDDSSDTWASTRNLQPSIINYRVTRAVVSRQVRESQSGVNTLFSLSLSLRGRVRQPYTQAS